MVAGNLTSEETELVRADLKLVKEAGTDGFSITFYVFLKGKKCPMSTWDIFILLQNAEWLLTIMMHSGTV